MTNIIELKKTLTDPFESYTNFISSLDLMLKTNKIESYKINKKIINSDNKYVVHYEIVKSPIVDYYTYDFLKRNKVKVKIKGFLVNQKMQQEFYDQELLEDED